MGNGTSIGRVRGLGSSHHGAHHWLMQRVTAVGNFVLTIYFAVSLLLMSNFSYEALAGWISAPVPDVAMALLVISVFWHARLGLQVLIEDYLHETGTKVAALLVLNLAAFAGAAFGLFCIARLAFAGGAA